MAIKTRTEYIESLREQEPNVFVAGKRIDSVVDNPIFRTTINNMGLGYEWSNDEQYKDLATAWSPLINEEVSFWTHLRSTEEDLFQMINAIRTFSGKYLCTMCMSVGLSVLWATTYEIDQVRGTDYHLRLRAFFKNLQKNDLRFCLGVMDPKGDRRLSPSMQDDPDQFLRIVERRADGIVVNGAKMHTTSAPCVHYFVASPSRVMGEADKDYAVSFAIPTDTKGLTFITRPAAGPLRPKNMESPISSEIGFVECLSVFDNVFIPWENVFMCGEWEFTPQFIHYFSSYVRLAKGTCLAARTDILAGVTALIAEYNGIENAGHVRSKLTDMMISSSIGWGCSVAAVKQCYLHPSEIAIPDILVANAGLYRTRLKYIEHLGTMQEVAGGIVTTLPGEEDFADAEIGPLVQKYLQGKTGVPSENRYRVVQLIQDMTASG